MSAPADFPVPFTPLGASKGGTLLFRQGGKLHLTCVLKSSFQFVSGAPMKMLAPRDLVRKEVNHYGNPCWSLSATNELVPYLPRVDVTMTGRACAPEGRWVSRANVRLAIFHGIALLDKTVCAYGDHSGKEFLPFERMPLEYERAFGGPGHLDNPYGTGILPGSPLPNLINPRDPGAVAGFGPLAQRLGIRIALLGRMSPAALTQPIPEFPDDFDWTYFQSAPADQRLPSIMGNEWIVLEGIHPTLTRISSRLPSLRPLATVFGTNPKDPEYARTLQLRIDMLSIDADALRCCVVARGVLQLDGDSVPKTLRVAGAMETEEISFAQVLTPPGQTRGMPVNVTVRMGDEGTTLPLPSSMVESIEAPTLRRPDQGKPQLTPTGTLALDIESGPAKPKAPKPIEVPIVDGSRSLAATLDTYLVDLDAPSVRQPAPPEPEWIDDAFVEEVYSVDPVANPLSVRAKMLQSNEE
ncbi:MAG TPA: DUF2169 domain-containing protein [Polyangium sp.]|nr:DUF2169 domain-containing protein [Polyangium sp.]